MGGLLRTSLFEVLEKRPVISRYVEIDVDARWLLDERGGGMRAGLGRSYSKAQRTLRPIFDHLFAAELGYKAVRVIRSRERAVQNSNPRRPSHRSGEWSVVECGWSLTRMEALASAGPLRRAWKFGDGENPVAWLQARRDYKIRLKGVRNIYIDTHGQVHELTHRDSSAAFEGGTGHDTSVGMSTMDINHMIWKLAMSMSSVPKVAKASKSEFDLRVQLKTKTDLTRLMDALAAKDDSMTELSEDTIVPNRSSFKWVESLALAERQEDLGAFAKLVDGKGGAGLLPATAIVGIGRDVLVKVPKKLSLLPLHFLLLARAHGFELGLSDAQAALKALSAQSGTTWRAALKTLVKGEYSAKAQTTLRQFRSAMFSEAQ